MHRTGAICGGKAVMSRLGSALALLGPVVKALGASTSHSTYVQGAKVIYFVLGPAVVMLAALLQRHAVTRRIVALPEAPPEAALGPTEHPPQRTVP